MIEEEKIKDLVAKIDQLMSTVEEPYLSLIIPDGTDKATTLGQFKVSVIQKELEARAIYAEVQKAEATVRLEKLRAELSAMTQ